MRLIFHIIFVIDKNILKLYNNRLFFTFIMTDNIDTTQENTTDPNQTINNTNKPDIWTNDIESILDSIRQNAIIMSEEHKKRYLILHGKLRYFRVPVIIISGINSVISVGLQPYISQSTISVATCLLSLTCGIIGSIELYLAIQTQMDNELQVSKEYYIMSTRIFAMLSLNHENRKIDGMDFFEEIFALYTSLIQKSIFINKKIMDRLLPIEDIIIVKAKRDNHDVLVLNSLNNPHKKHRNTRSSSSQPIEKYYEIDYQNTEEDHYYDNANDNQSFNDTNISGDRSEPSNTSQTNDVESQTQSR